MKTIPDALVEGIISGNAVLFAGAGFSRECENISSSRIVAAEDLSERICNLGEFDTSKNLMYSSERYISAAPENSSNLVEFLKKNYIAKNVKPYIDKILKFKWKAIYTTNYHNVIELSFKNRGIDIIPIDMEKDIDQLNKNKLNCIHINGFIKTLTVENLNKTFKLTNSSYCNPDGFLNSPWYTIFKRTIERCSALVFVGYSLYDIDIKRLLISINGLKERTFFITSPTSTDEEIFTLGQFGNVSDCGVELFSTCLPDPSLITYSHPKLSSLVKYSPNSSEVNIRDADVDNLLLYGQYKKDIIENVIFENNDSEYIVIRESLSRIKNLIMDSNIAIVSELGNGKTIYLQQILPFLSKIYPVYYVTDYFGDIISDLELLSKEDSMSIVVIDDYNTLINLFDSYKIYSKEKLRFIISARSSVHEHQRDILKKAGFEFKEMSIDLFSDGESTSLTKLIDSVGWWGSLNKNYKNTKSYFINECNSQISSLLISLLNSPDIISRIKYVFDKLLSDTTIDLQCIVITTAYLCMQNVRVDTALVSEIAGNSVYDTRLHNNESFCEFFKFEYGKLKSKSTIFCRSLIQNYFSPDYTISFLLNLAKMFDSKRNKSKEHNEIFKSTLKFSTIERLLPNDGKRENLEKYYESLKRKVKWLIYDPHFWVQYAMAKIATPDFDKAQQYLDNAYAKAKHKDNYDTSNIDTQQARLYLLRATKAKFTLEAPKLFADAHRLLCKTPNDIYKYRQLYLYIEYYDKVFNLLDIKSKNNFIYSCKEILYIIQQDIPQGVPQYYNTLIKLKDLSNLVVNGTI